MRIQSSVLTDVNETGDFHMNSSCRELSLGNHWSHSTVTTFGSQRRNNRSNPEYMVELLTEGSSISVAEGTSQIQPSDEIISWHDHESLSRKYLGKSIGGTVVVHFIKKNTWFLETVLAFLEGDDFTPVEIALQSA